jgi:hypothetical protein
MLSKRTQCLQTHVFLLLKLLRLKRLLQPLPHQPPLLQLLMQKIRLNDLKLHSLQQKARASGLSFWRFVEKLLYL